MDKAAEGLEVDFSKIRLKDEININMVEVTNGQAMDIDEQVRQEEHNKVAYPREDETMVDFIYRCQKKGSEVMLCPRCSSVFDKKAAQNLEGVRKAKEGWN